MILHYLRFLGVIFSDSSPDDCGAGRALFSLLLCASSAFNLMLFPSVVHDLDDWSEALASSFTAITCSATAVATIAAAAIETRGVARRGRRKYRTTLEGFELYNMPANGLYAGRIGFWSLASIAACAAVVLPVNAAKLWNVFNHHARSSLLTAYFFFYYAQNFRQCCTELHFAVQCFVVQSKFRGINDELRRVRRECNCDRRRRRGADRGDDAAAIFRVDDDDDDDDGGHDGGHDGHHGHHGRDDFRDVVYERDFYRPNKCYEGGAPRGGGEPTANTVELLRIKHWLSREALGDLNGMFSLKIGLSLGCVLVSALLDVYIEVFHAYTHTEFEHSVYRSNALFVGWLLQDCFRFCLIVISAHTTTKQAAETKKLVTEMNDRSLDFSTSEELHIFYNQLSVCSVKFTVCDIFTLNNSLFTSAVAVFATYIIMLVQFHSKWKN